MKALWMQLFLADKSHLYQLRLSCSVKWLSTWAYNTNVITASTRKLFFRCTILIKWYQFIKFRPALLRQTIFCSSPQRHSLYVLLCMYTQLSSFPRVLLLPSNILTTTTQSARDRVEHVSFSVSLSLSSSCYSTNHPMSLWTRWHHRLFL